MRKYMKKGQTDSVIGAILIGIAIVAIIIIGLVISKVSLHFSPGNECLRAKISPSILVQNECFNNKTNQIEVLMQKIDDKETYSMRFSVLNYSWQCGEGCSGCSFPVKDELTTYYFDYPEFNSQNSSESLTGSLIINGCNINTANIKNC